MPLLNYTTSIEVEKSVAEITRLLVRHNAGQIAVDYQDRRPAGISFVLPTPFGAIRYQLPVRTKAVLATLRAQLKARKLQPRYASPEQAERVAWRIVKDWLEAQLAFIETGMTEATEVLLPYQVGSDGQTMYAFMAGRRLGLPAPGGRE